MWHRIKYCQLKQKHFVCKVRFKPFNHCFREAFAFHFGQKCFMRNIVSKFLRRSIKIVAGNHLPSARISWGGEFGAFETFRKCIFEKDTIAVLVHLTLKYTWKEKHFSKKKNSIKEYIISKDKIISLIKAEKNK